MKNRFLITAGICASLIVPYAAPAADKTANTTETYRLLSLFGDVFERVRNDYVEPVSDEQLIESALNGMLTSLDPHSNYVSPKNYKDMQVQITGEFGGLGIEVTMENGWVKVISPIDDTPASRAGIRPGDYITHLNGELVQGMSLNDAVDHMRGPINTDIKITVRREGQAPFDLTLTRANVQIKTVRAKLVDNVGYIRISQFVASTDAGLKKAIEQVKKESNGKLQGIVLDLRNDPGGLLDQAIAVSSEFLDKGEVVSTRSRRAEETQRYDAHGKDMTDGLPMVVLINDGTASASEIVAGALQDHRRAVLMGTKSFGKGSVQTIIPFGQQGGAIRLTTARYYTPSGRSIQALGIEPDIKVAQSKVEALDAPPGLVRSEAQLKGALRNDTIKDNKDSKGKGKDSKDSKDNKDKEPAKQPNEAQDGAAPPANDNKAPAETAAAPVDPLANFGNPAVDYQLSRALDLLHGLSLYKGVAKAN